jgi:transposase
METLIGIRQAQKILNISRSSAYAAFPTWRKFGLTIFKAQPNAAPRFREEDLLAVARRIANQAEGK